MSEAETTEQQTEEESKPSKGGIKVIAIIAVLMLLEGAGVVVFMTMTSGGSHASARMLAGQDESIDNATTEVELIETRFQNMQTGRVWDWETSIYLKVPDANIEHVQEELDQHKAEIHEGIARIFRRAQHAQLKEPGLQTLTRQLTSYLDSVLGTDADGNSYFERVLIPQCDGYPADF